MVEAIALMSQGWGSSCCRHTRELEIPATTYTSCALVVSDSQLAGLLSEQDALRLVALESHWQSMKVAHAMTRPVATLRASEFLDGLPALRLMQQHGINDLPILDENGQPLGLVTLKSGTQVLNPVAMAATKAQLQQQLLELTIENVAGITNPETECEQHQQERAEELKAQVERGNLLAAVAQRIRSSLKLEEVLNAAVAEVRQMLQADRVLIYQFAPDMSGEIVTESVGSDWTACLHIQIRDSCFPEGIAQKYRQGHRWICPNIYEAGLTECHLQLLERFAVKANLVVPILIGDHLWGLLVAHQCSSPRYWKASELELLDQLSVHLAIAIQQATAFEQAQRELAERQQVEASLRRAYQQLTFHGQSTSDQVAQATNAKVEAFLSKPYSSEELLTALRDVLDS